MTKAKLSDQISLVLYSVSLMIITAGVFNAYL